MTDDAKPGPGAATGLFHRRRERFAPLRESVFAKLFAIMVTMAACLVLLVSGFFWGVVSPALAGGRVHEAHAALFAALLLVLTAVVLAAHAVLRRLLQPLRGLSDGVAQLSAGRLDVVLPSHTRDEFGALTAAFNQMVGRVKGMIGARDQLLLDVSHELRSPVTRLKVALELLPDGEPRAGMAADVAEMERTIAELLELERLRDARGIKTARQDLMALVTEVVRDFANRAPGVRMASTFRAMHVEIDGDRVRTVLRNLLENAVKYSQPTSAPVDVSASEDGDLVAIRITDDGVGIPEGDRERIFEPFFRVDRSRSKSTGGYGLGLSICKRVMEAHGGSIRMERPTRGGGGASFVLIFPRRRPLVETLCRTEIGEGASRALLEGRHT